MSSVIRQSELCLLRSKMSIFSLVPDITIKESQPLQRWMLEAGRWRREDGALGGGFGTRCWRLQYPSSLRQSDGMNSWL